MQTDVDNQRFGEVDAHIMNDLRQMLQSSNSYMRSFTAIDEQLQATLFPQSVSLQLLPDHHPNIVRNERNSIAHEYMSL